MTDPRVQEVARRADLRVIDISTLNATDRFNHDLFITFAAMYSSVVADGGRGDPLRQAGAYVFNAAGTALATPFDLAGRALAGE